MKIILILSILTTQSAWAVYGVDLDNANTSTELSYSQQADQEQHANVSDSCNHLCHGGAHFFGMFTDNSNFIAAASNSFQINTVNFSPSLNDCPLNPPPIS